MNDELTVLLEELAFDKAVNEASAWVKSGAMTLDQLIEAIEKELAR